MVEMKKLTVASVNASDAPFGMSAVTPVRPRPLGTAVAAANPIIAAHVPVKVQGRGVEQWQQMWAFGGGMAGRTFTTLDDDGYGTTGLPARRPPN